MDTAALRRAFGSYLTGVTVVTALGPTGPVGFTANSFTSVSLNPPLLLVCPGNHLSSFAVFEQASHFAVNILAEGQEALATLFARPTPDRFAQCRWHPDPAGVPLLAGCVARFSCATHQCLRAGDHLVLIGQVSAFEHDPSLHGLGYGGGGFFSLTRERMAEASATQGQRALVGALIEAQGALWLVEGPDGWHPPRLPISNGKGARSVLQAALTEQGLMVSPGPVYSIFTDAGAGQHFTYFRVDSPQPWPGCKPVPLAVLNQLHCDSRATATMLARYATEAQSRNFSLYVGDAESGDIHPLAGV